MARAEPAWSRSKTRTGETHRGTRTLLGSANLTMVITCYQVSSTAKRGILHLQVEEDVKSAKDIADYYGVQSIAGYNDSKLDANERIKVSIVDDDGVHDGLIVVSDDASRLTLYVKSDDGGKTVAKPDYVAYGKSHTTD